MGSTKLKVGGGIVTVAAVLFGLSLGLAGDPPTSDAGQPLVPQTNPRPIAAQPQAPDDAALPVNERNFDLTTPAVFKSANFIVHAPSETQARVIATEAEHQRKEIAKRWFGKEAPVWNQSCVIHFKHSDQATSGTTTFSFGVAPSPTDGDKVYPLIGVGRSFMASAEMQLTGPFLIVVECELPHEVTHCLLAGHFGKPLPRWADEGIALLSEPAAQRTGYDIRVREVLAAGRAIRLKHLFKMTEYPKDTVVLYAQGFSVVRFLSSRSKASGMSPGSLPTATLMTFLQKGMEGDWDKAAKLVYGFDSVDDLEAAWIDWLKTPGSKLNAKAQQKPVSPKDEKPELIPPTKLPGTGDPKLPTPDR